MKRFQAIRKNKKGFTLVEVIVVLVILAILAAMLVPSMTGWISKAESQTAIVEGRTFLLSAQTVASENFSKYMSATVQDMSADPKIMEEIMELSELQDATVKVLEVSQAKIYSFEIETSGNAVFYDQSKGLRLEK